MQRRLKQIEESVARYLHQLDSADRQEPSPVIESKIERLTEKIVKLKDEMRRLKGLEKRMMAAADKQVSLTDPDARSMATSGRGSGTVGYNVQASVDTTHHLIVAHDVTTSGSDRAQLSRMGKRTKAVLRVDELDVVADRGYFSSEEILACHEANITVTLPKPMTSGNRSKGRFVKQDFRYVPGEDLYICPAGERLSYRYRNQEKGLLLRRYWSSNCRDCAIRNRCTTGRERRITRWAHEHLLDEAQHRLDQDPGAMRRRRETVEHPFGTIKARMGATHFLMKRLRNVRTEMALHVLVLGAGPLIQAMRA
jgi:transposase